MIFRLTSLAVLSAALVFPASPRLADCFKVHSLLRMDRDHYWADWSNACPYTIDSVYVLVQFADRSRVPIGEGVWALHFVVPGAHQVTRFTAPRNVPDFDSVRVHKITASSEEALLEPLPVPDRPLLAKVDRAGDHVSIPDLGRVALPAFASIAPPAIDPMSAAEHNRRGRELLRTKNYAAAIDELSEAIRQKPDYSIAYNARGFARYLSREYQPAIADLDEAIRLNPKYVNAYQNRSHARRAAGDISGSIADMKTIRQLLQK